MALKGGTGDIDAGAGTVTAVATGSVAALFKSGADAPLTYEFGTTAELKALLEAQGLKSGGVGLTYTVTAGLITATVPDGDGTKEIFTLSLDKTTGNWEFTLKGPLDHAAPPEGVLAFENDLVIEFGALVQAKDSDGDMVAATGSQLTVTVNDDTSTLGLIPGGDVSNLEGAKVSKDFAYASGADGLKNFIIDQTSGLSGLTFTQTVGAGGETTLTAKIGTQVVYTLVLTDIADPTLANYSFTVKNPEIETTGTTDLGTVKPGNYSHIELANGLLEFESVNGALNTSIHGIGIQNNFLAAGESVMVEFHQPGTGVGVNDAAGANGLDVKSVTFVVDLKDTYNPANPPTITWKVTDHQVDVNGNPITVTKSGESDVMQVNGQYVVTIASAELPQFDTVLITGKDGELRMGEVSYTYSIPPSDVYYQFGIKAMDGDGDTTDVQYLNIHQTAAPQDSIVGTSVPINEFVVI